MAAMRQTFSQLRYGPYAVDMRDRVILIEFLSTGSHCLQRRLLRCMRGEKSSGEYYLGRSLRSTFGRDVRKAVALGPAATRGRRRDLPVGYHGRALVSGSSRPSSPGAGGLGADRAAQRLLLRAIPGPPGRAWGANCILVIIARLTDLEVQNLVSTAHELGMDTDPDPSPNELHPNMSASYYAWDEVPMAARLTLFTAWERLHLARHRVVLVHSWDKRPASQHPAPCRAQSRR
jgi:hypothetical protein